jgi:hypothetical protein
VRPAEAHVHTCFHGNMLLAPETCTNDTQITDVKTDCMLRQRQLIGGAWAPDHSVRLPTYKRLP